MARAFLSIIGLLLIFPGDLRAADLVLGKKLLVKNPTGDEDRRLVMILAKETPPDFVFSNLPAPSSASLQVILNGATPSDETYALGAPGQWEGSGPGASGVLKYTGGDPVKLLMLKQTGGGTFLLKAKLKGNAGTAILDLVPPNPGTSGGIILTLDQGFGPQQFCVAFGGLAGGDTSKNDVTQWKVTNPDGEGCPVAGTSTTVTSTSSTTVTTAAGCCGGKLFHGFTSANVAGDCGDIIEVSGAQPFGALQCGKLYLGGGQNVTSHPEQLPDLSRLVTAISSCTGNTATLAATSSVATGSLLNCTAVGCKVGAPVPIVIPSPGFEDLLLCMVGTVSGTVSGTLDCSSGAENLTLPVTWDVYGPANIAGSQPDPGHVIPGSQACPICSGGSCIGGPNNGMACTPGTTAINNSFPTSQDCPPAPSVLSGTITHDLQLTTGTVTWTASPATNDTGSTAGAQDRVFSGYCRDLALPGGSGSFDAGAAPGHQFKKCWENGMAVGTPCSEADNGAETCEQRNNGAFFGPGGGAVMTISAVGSPQTGINGGGAAAGTLVGLFSNNGVDNGVNAADQTLDLPGPGAITMPGTGTLCMTANPCP